MPSILSYSQSTARHQLFRILFATLFFTLSFLLIAAKPSFAQTNTSSDINNFKTSTDTPIDLRTLTPHNPNYGNMIIYNLIHTFSCIAVGQSQISPCLEYKLSSTINGIKNNTPVLSSTNETGGLLGFQTSLLSNLYVYKPIHTGEYFADLGSQIGITKPANAQVSGSGNAVLSPVFNLWKASRNFAYLGMILIFVAIGLMVMFRQKLNPQTVVTVQLALPGLVIGLILITFSYFLASLITDLAYVGTGVVGYYFDQATGTESVNLVKLLETNNVISLGSEFVGKLDPDALKEGAESMLKSVDDESSSLGWRNIWLSPQQTIRATIAAVSYQLGSTLLTGAAAVIGGGALATVGTLGGGAIAAATAAGATAPAWVVPAIATAFGIQTFGGPAAGTISAIYAYNNPGSVLSLIISLLLIFVVLYAILRILIALLTAYLSLIVFTILAPFIFLIGSLPGNSDSFSGWARSMIANALAFPVIMAAMYLAAILMGPGVIKSFNIAEAPPPHSLMTAYAQGNPTGVSSQFTLPGLGLLNNKVINQGIAIIVLLSASSLPGMLKEALAKGDRLGKGLEGAFNQNMGGGRGWQNALYSGAGSYYGSTAKTFSDWRGNPPGSSKAYQFANLIGRTPASLPVFMRPYEGFYEAKRKQWTLAEGAHGTHERAAQRLNKANSALQTGLDSRGKQTVDPSDVDYTEDTA
jgi:hypothetical protein